MIQLLLGIFLETFRENHKKQKIMINIFFLFLAYFSKTIGLGSAVNADIEFCMQKYPNKWIFIGFSENTH